jgi:hypothetical protein
LAGRLPHRGEYEEFLADTAPDKRSKLIDKLLASEDFVDLWTMKWGELLKIRSSNQVSYKALYKYHHWLRDRIAADAGFDEIVRDLLSAQGGTFDNPPTNYYQIEPNTLLLAENVAQVFLGIRIQCAQCHNHPFDRWTMDDYYGFAAFFSQVDFKQSPDPREFIVYNRGNGEVRHPVDQREVAPKFLAGDVPEIKEGEDRRAVLASWLTSSENAMFGRNLANIIWAHHFGRGIVEPVDDVRVSNPPAQPELLAGLAQLVARHDYKLRGVIRDICHSRTYQLAVVPNETNSDDESHFSRALIRRMRAEVLLDNLSQVTETKDRLPRLPAGSRSVEIVDGASSNYFLSTFGRASRQTVCSCEVNVEPNLSQAFHLLNGENTTGKIETGGLIRRRLDEGWSVDAIVEDLFIRCYTRQPTENERDRLVQRVEAATDKAQELEDLLWAILNSKEFVFNH